MALQLELRRLFHAAPPHVALRGALRRIGDFMGAQYSVQHAVFGATMLSEEWVADSFEPSELMRESLNNALSQALDQQATRCLRIGRDNDMAPAILSAAIFGEDPDEPCGAAGMLIPPCSRARAHELLIQFEGLFGFLALLANSEGVYAERLESELGDFELALPPSLLAGADHPVKLALFTVSQFRSRHGLDQVAIGTVDAARQRVVVRAVSGMDELRTSNPGVQRIRAAMEECYDQGRMTLSHGGGAPHGEAAEDDYRLLGQWSRSVGGDAVACIPVMFAGEVVGVLSLRHKPDGTMRRGRLAVIQKDAASLGPLLPLTEQAGRSIVRHARDSLQTRYERIAASSKRKLTIAGVCLLAVVGWLTFGTLSYTVTVPAAVAAEQSWTMAAPHTGRLVAVHAEPGDQVLVGQLLVEFDVREEALRLAEVVARIQSLGTEIDAARASGELGQMTVQAARKGALEAERELLQQRVDNARLVAPVSGVVLDGEVQHQLGAVVAVGTPLMRVGSLDPVVIEASIPEQRLKDGLDAAHGVFAPNAHPDQKFTLGQLKVVPAAVIQNGRNVFPARGTAFSEPGQLLPGMEGACRLNLGSRPAWWVLSNRLSHWLHLNFWL